MRRGAFSLIELLSALGIVTVLAVVVATTAMSVYRNSSLAVSANNIRQLSAGGVAYLAEHNHIYWPYREDVTGDRPGVRWWWGFESQDSMGRAEGRREFDPADGPLAGYVPASIRPDPSLALGGRTFKPKYKSGYIGVGYNTLLGGGALGTAELYSYWKMPRPSEIVVFATSAQVNTFQSPASTKNPMLEEFYMIDSREYSVHFRHHGNAMVGYADGSAGFIPIDPKTRDPRMPKANVGRFAPVGNSKYLLPSS